MTSNNIIQLIQVRNDMEVDLLQLKSVYKEASEDLINSFDGRLFFIVFDTDLIGAIGKYPNEKVFCVTIDGIDKSISKKALLMLNTYYDKIEKSYRKK